MKKTKSCKGGVNGDCKRPHYAKGFCNPHFQMFKKGLPTNYEIAEKSPHNQRTVCTIEGCGLPHRAMGLCTKHYAKHRYHERKKARA